MSPETAAAVIVALMILCILASAASLMDWIADTVYPGMWKVGEQFDMAPTVWEVRAQKTTKGVAHLFRVMLVGLVVSVFF
jgi:hypothetical protein